MSMDDKLIDLEVRIAFQDRLIADLDEVVRRFAARVEALESELAEVRHTLLAGQEPVGAADEPPPHY
jgi:SlyX protein